MLCSPSIVVTKTKTGTHCPTAMVQQVRTADGTLRTPQLGDEDFKQCACAEKKTAQEKMDLERIALSTVIPAISIAPIQFPDIPFLLAGFWAPFNPLPSHLADLAISPPVPPPNAA